MKSAKQFNIHDAKTHFSRLVERAGSGEEIVISRAGVPLVRLVPVARKVERRFPGSAGTRLKLASSFDAPLPKKLLKSFLS